MEKTTTWSALCRSVESAWPADRYRDVGVVVGCSGGADSVALLRVLHTLCGPEARGFLIAAHYNHNLRGDESMGDESFVRQLATELNVPFELRRGDGQRHDENSARQERRTFFRDVAKRTGARYITLGHSLDDNVETVLHRLMRGSGPAGLTGIASFSSLGNQAEDSDFVIARPLLQVRRSMIREALREQDCRWREDSSNASNDYKRNWIRNELLPRMQSEYSDPVGAVSRAIEGQRQWSQCLESLTDRWLEENRLGDSPLTLRVLSPADEKADALTRGQAIAVEALRRCWLERGWPLQSMGKTHWDALYQALLGQGPASFTLPGDVMASLENRCLMLSRKH